MEKSYEMDMCNGPIFGKVLSYSIPLMLSGVLQLLFNAADVIVVGRFAGSQSLAAVGSTSSLINLLINVFIGLSIGGIGRGYCNCVPPVSGVYYAGIVSVHVCLCQFGVGKENGCTGGISLCIFTDSSGGHFYPVCGRRGTGIHIFADRSAWFLSDRDRAEEAIDRLDSLINRYVGTDIFPHYIHSSYRDSFNTPLHCLYKKNLEE